MKSQMLFTLEEYVGNGLWRQKIVGLDEYANALTQHSYKPLPRRPRMPTEEMDMLEKVARALSTADGMHPDAASNDEDETPAWKLYLGSARAALKAMREPIKEMARSECMHENTEHVADIWGAWIDAALKEHEGR